MRRLSLLFLADSHRNSHMFAHILHSSGPSLLILLRPIIIFVVTVALGILLQFIVLRRMGSIAQRLIGREHRQFQHSLRIPVIFWSVLLGIGLALPQLPFRLDRAVLGIIQQILLFTFIVSLTVVIARIVTDLIKYASRPAARQGLSIVTNIISVAIYFIGALFALQVFSISITPALAALGVTGLAVSLALQATLTDVVSGIQIIAAHQPEVGSYVRLSSGEEGYVSDITWRTTSIRQLSNNVVIVPNSKMTSSIVTNYFQPEKTLSISIEISVNYDNDLDLVEQTTVEVAKDVMANVPGGIPSFEPFIRYQGFEDANVHFTVNLQGKEYTDQYLIKHEFIKRLQRRYRSVGITLARPQRAISVEDGMNGQGERDLQRLFGGHEQREKAEKR
jgi:small-conductance mechanosensitive channel